MNLRTILFFAVLTPAVAQAQSRTLAERIRLLHDPQTRQILVVAHRGDWRNAPENSAKSLAYAIEAGADMVEIDLKKSKDGVLMLLHDPTLDRTTTGHGKPEDYTWAELQRLTLKNEHGGPSRQKIQTFEECMLQAKGKVLVNIDKGYDYFREAYDVLVKTGTVDHAVIKSGKTYEEVKAENGDLLGGKLVYMPIVNLNRKDAGTVLESYRKNLRPVAYELNFSADSTLERSGYRQLTGSKIWFNSLWANQNGGHDDELSVEEQHPEAGWGWLIERGATLIQTDRPRELVDFLRKKGLYP